MLEISTDAEIIAACDEDPERFRELFDRHFAAILGFLSRRLGPGAAEDLALDAFATAYRRRKSFDASRSSARPWLLGIATNLARHHRRAERRRLLADARTGVDPAEALFDPGFEKAEARIEAQAARPAMARALASLRADERDVLLLHAWAELSYAEIAEALTIPVGTVRSRLSRARSKTRELLAASGQLPDADLDDEGTDR